MEIERLDEDGIELSEGLLLLLDFILSYTQELVLQVPCHEHVENIQLHVAVRHDKFTRFVAISYRHGCRSAHECEVMVCLFLLLFVRPHSSKETPHADDDESIRLVSTHGTKLENFVSPVKGVLSDVHVCQTAEVVGVVDTYTVFVEQSRVRALYVLHVSNFLIIMMRFPNIERHIHEEADLVWCVERQLI